MGVNVGQEGTGQERVYDWRVPQETEKNMAGAGGKAPAAPNIPDERPAFGSNVFGNSDVNLAVDIGFIIGWVNLLKLRGLIRAGDKWK
jgi:hypothetical protein